MGRGCQGPGAGRATPAPATLRSPPCRARIVGAGSRQGGHAGRAIAGLAGSRPDLRRTTPDRLWLPTPLRLQIKQCDQVLQEVESALARFQTDLGSISSEIRLLQTESQSLNGRLRSKRALRVWMGGWGLCCGDVDGGKGRQGDACLPGFSRREWRPET